ncbi:MAG: hypothetical protein K2L93_04015, partial [Muribaculaceae bacterium]|nr:hypothetical protein [Muribaculaceae bacterium]
MKTSLINRDAVQAGAASVIYKNIGNINSSHISRRVHNPRDHLISLYIRDSPLTEGLLLLF